MATIGHDNLGSDASKDDTLLGSPTQRTELSSSTASGSANYVTTHE